MCLSLDNYVQFFLSFSLKWNLSLRKYHKRYAFFIISGNNKLLIVHVFSCCDPSLMWTCPSSCLTTSRSSKASCPTCSPESRYRSLTMTSSWRPWWRWQRGRTCSLWTSSRRRSSRPTRWWLSDTGTAPSWLTFLPVSYIVFIIGLYIWLFYKEFTSIKNF